MVDAIISVRAQSTRLPHKCFLDFGGKTVLQHGIERCVSFGLDPIVATTKSSADRRIVDIACDASVRCFTGESDDKLVRWLCACDAFSVDSFVTVDCDDPFFDPKLAQECHTSLTGVDVVAPDMDAFLGSNGWGLRTEALRLSCSEKSSDKTEMIADHLSSGLRFHKLDAFPAPIENGLRLTLDYEEDYWLLKTVLRELGHLCTREQIVGFFEENKGLRRVNEFRNHDWQLHQRQG